MKMEDWRVRTFFASSVLLAPFLQFVVRHQYGLWHVEVAAAAGLLMLECAVLGMAARGPLFYAALAGLAGVSAAGPLQSLAPFLSRLSPWLVAAAMAGVFWLAASRMREKAMVILAVFAWSGVFVDLLLPHGRRESAVYARSGQAFGHVLWLVMDENIGLDGFPRDLPMCTSAEAKLRGVLDGRHFTLFPGAYSNYPMTADSVPSIFHGRLLSHAGELMKLKGTGGVRNYEMPENALVKSHAARGFRAVVWQHAAMRVCGTPSSAVACRDYGESIGWLHRAPGGWTERFGRLIGTYQASDPLRVRFKGFFPFRFGATIGGPPSLEGIWPDGIAREIEAAAGPTLFLAHLLTPHTPYLYRHDGALRPIHEWAGDRTGERLPEQEYRESYERYCEQAEFAAGQLERLLWRLENDNLLGVMTVVVHGDHGSRIRRVLRLEGGHRDAGPSFDDYQGTPDARDLSDRFSTLLAIRRPGAARSETITERHSVLTLISRHLFGREPYDGARADQVYLKSGTGEYHAIDIRKYWR